MKLRILIGIAALILASCSGAKEKSDAYGNFETDETMISAETYGKIIMLNVEEGSKLKAGDTVAVIDTSNLVLQLESLRSKKQAARSKMPNVFAQIEVLEQKKRHAENELQRLERLYKDSAATDQQLDEARNAVEVLEKQMKSIETQNSTIVNEVEALEAQMKQIRLALRKSVIVNPTDGTVLNKFVEKFEIAAPGKPLYSIANLEKMNLRVYVSGDQLPDIKIGQKVKVYIDETKETNRELDGKVKWTASEAEFTPKIIQTKEERVNLVYAVKVEVENDGALKIGMPGSIDF